MSDKEFLLALLDELKLSKQQKKSCKGNLKTNNNEGNLTGINFILRKFKEVYGNNPLEKHTGMLLSSKNELCCFNISNVYKKLLFLRINILKDKNYRYDLLKGRLLLSFE